LKLFRKVNFQNGSRQKISENRTSGKRRTYSAMSRDDEINDTLNLVTPELEKMKKAMENI